MTEPGPTQELVRFVQDRLDDNNELAVQGLRTFDGYELALLILCEIDAKRRILAAHREHPTEPNFCATCGSTAGPCETKRLLALPYAGHPDYRQEWTPWSSCD